MLSRAQFTSLRVVGLALGLATAIGLAGLAHRRTSIAWLRWIAEMLALGVGLTIYQLLGGNYPSYRKYQAAVGGPYQPPSQFWATSGQLVVWLIGGVLLTGLSMLGRRAAPTSWLQPMVVSAWLFVPGVCLVYLLIARDWRDELATHGVLPNDR
jgi:hypothetical protein